MSESEVEGQSAKVLTSRNLSGDSWRFQNFGDLFRALHTWKLNVGCKVPRVKSSGVKGIWFAVRVSGYKF